MKNIKFIYFDVGGVLLLDYSGTNKWTQMKRDLGVTKELDDAFNKIWSKHKLDRCINYHVDKIIPELEKNLGIKVPSNYSMLEDFVDRFEKNNSIWAVAKKAKEKYKVGLLTNMYPKMLPLIQDKNLIPNIKWDVVIDSSIVSFQKPNNEFYEIAENMSKVKPEEIFFIDNSVEHLESASKRGWKTMLYDPRESEKYSEKLENILKLPL